MQPSDPDHKPTEPLGDLWQPPAEPDTVDSAQRKPTRRRPGATVLGVAAAVLALVAAGAFGAVRAGGSDSGEVLNGVAARGSTDEDTPNDGGDDGSLRDRLEKWADKRGHGPMLRHGFGGPGLGPLMGRGLHGSFVVEDPDGGYQTVLTQQGEATEVSDSSITVRSEDGYEATYRLTDDTTVLGGLDGTDSIEEGAQVAVTGVREGGRTHAVHVLDMSQMRERLERHLGDLPDSLDEAPDETPSGTATSGASV